MWPINSGAARSTTTRRAAGAGPPGAEVDPAFTRVLVVTLPELIPRTRRPRPQTDLRRAGIEPYGWVINASLTGSGTRDPLLAARAALERPHLHRVRDQLARRAWLVRWQPADTSGGS
jgi:arsenite-transporting ATPase